MRTSDIWQARQNPSYVKTDKLYMDTDKPVSQMSLDECKRGLCAAANGDVLKCESCAAPCKFGRRIVELLKPVEMEEKTLTNAKKMAIEKAVNARKEKSENAYLAAIASGDPLKWLQDHGRETVNSMRLLKARFGDMTAEEAKARLDAKGTNLPMYEHTVARKPAEEAKQEAVAVVECAAEKPIGLKLRVASLEGAYFSYELERNGKLCMTTEDSDVHVPLDEIRAMCEEICRAAEVLKEGVAV